MLHLTLCFIHLILFISLSILLTLFISIIIALLLSIFYTCIIVLTVSYCYFDGWMHYQYICIAVLIIYALFNQRYIQYMQMA
jgi:hypothetical protein